MNSPENPNEDVFKAVVGAYYPTVVVAAPTAARARAQAGYTIAAAIATALVTAGVFTDFEKRHLAVKVLGGIALGGWIAAALTFMWAVSIGFFDKQGRRLRHRVLKDIVTPGNLESLIDNLRREERKINWTILVAFIFSCIASAATIATFLIALFVAPTVQANVKTATLVLSADGKRTVDALCPKRPTGPTRPQITTLAGNLNFDSLNKTLVEIAVPEGKCAAAASTLSIPRKQVLGVAAGAPPAGPPKPNQEAAGGYVPSPATRQTGCRARGAVPDGHCTPGAVIGNASVTEICTRGYASSVRNVPSRVKVAIYAAYDIRTRRPGEYEVDHLISLQLGGSNAIANLWPEAASPKPGFHEKDRLENALHKQLCSGSMSLANVQRIIAVNWLAAYKLFVDGWRSDTPRSDRTPSAPRSSDPCRSKGRG